MRKSLLLIGAVLMFSGTLVAQTNLITNNNFSNNAEGFTFKTDNNSTITVDNTDSNDGDGVCIKIATTAAHSKGNKWNNGVRVNPVAITNGKTYTASVWIKTDAIDAQTIWFRVDWKSSYDSPDDQDTDPDLNLDFYEGSAASENKGIKNTDGWVQFVVNDVIPDKVTKTNIASTDDPVTHLSPRTGMGLGIGNFYVDNFELFEKTATSISDVSVEKLKISVAPDGSQLGFIGKNNGEIAIYNLSGQVVKRAQLNGNTINISDLAKGMYIVKLDNSTAKFVK